MRLFLVSVAILLVSCGDGAPSSAPSSMCSGASRKLSTDVAPLVKKLTGVGMCANTQRMPLGSPLSDADVQIIIDWICAGAPND